MLCGSSKKCLVKQWSITSHPYKLTALLSTLTHLTPTPLHHTPLPLSYSTLSTRCILANTHTSEELKESRVRFDSLNKEYKVLATTKQRLEAELADSFKKCKAREQLIANLEVSYLINILLEYLIRISY